MNYFIFIFYWGDIGPQNHTGFKSKTQQNVICTLHRVPITPSNASVCPHFAPFCPLLPTPTPFSLWLSPQCCLCSRVMYMFSFCLIPSHSFIQSPNTPPLWQLSVCSMYPCPWFSFAHSLFCSLDTTDQ